MEPLFAVRMTHDEDMYYKPGAGLEAISAGRKAWEKRIFFPGWIFLM